MSERLTARANDDETSISRILISSQRLYFWKLCKQVMQVFFGAIKSEREREKARGRGFDRSFISGEQLTLTKESSVSRGVVGARFSLGLVVACWLPLAHGVACSANVNSTNEFA